MPQDLTISIVQTELSWENSERNIAHFEILLNQVPATTDLVVLPEMFNTGFTMNAQPVAQPVHGPACQWLVEQSKKHNYAITGSIVTEENGKYYNRLHWVTPDGKVQTYDKRHLFRMANEHHHYTAGNTRLITQLKGWKICPLVCYDLRFPVWIRNRKEYDCLVFIANWPEARSNAWSTLLQARAIENQVYAVGVNRIGTDGNNIPYSGDSAVIDPKGTPISNTKPNQESVETVTLNWNDLESFRKKFPVMEDADDFTIDLQ